jgi:hypothetical protein
VKPDDIPSCLRPEVADQVETEQQKGDLGHKKLRLLAVTITLRA